MQKIDKMAAEELDEVKGRRVALDVVTKLRSDAVGPVWRAADGGALVPCVLEHRRSTAVQGGGYLEWDGRSRYKVDVPGFRVTSYVDTNITMALVAIPPATGAASTLPDLATEATYPLDLTYKEAKR